MYVNQHLNLLSMLITVGTYILAEVLRVLIVPLKHDMLIQALHISFALFFFSGVSKSA